MTTTATILLSIGIAFAIIYALTIILGWATTRACRKKIITDNALSSLPILVPNQTPANDRHRQTTVSLLTNTFLDKDNSPVDPSLFDAYIAGEGNWAAHPAISPGNLLLLDKTTHEIKHIFDVPDIANYR